VSEYSACVAYRQIAKLAENSTLADTIVLRDIRDLFEGNQSILTFYFDPIY